MVRMGLSPSQMEYYVLPYGSEWFVHVPNQSALTEVFQDASKIGFNLPYGRLPVQLEYINLERRMELDCTSSGSLTELGCTRDPGPRI